MVLQSVAEPGTIVKKGDVIAEFDRQYQLTRLDDYRASVAQFEASYRKDESEADVTWEAHGHSIAAAEAKLDKAKLDVRASPVLSAIQAEKLRLALEEAEAELAQLREESRFVQTASDAELRNAQLDVKQAEVELERAVTNVDRLLVKAPMDGMAVMMNTFRNGEFGQVKAGDELWSGQPFMQVVDLNSMVVDATVNQVDVEEIRIGQRAKVYFDAFPGLELPARVYSIGTVAKGRQFRQEFVKEVPVKLKLSATDPRVIPDLSVSAEIILGESEAAPVVPRRGVFTDRTTGESYVWVRNGQDWERRPVEVETQNHVSVAIRSGLKEGEEVALNPPVSSEP